MLILARKTNQQIMIGDDIVITITAIHHNQTKVGIQAPRSVQIDRSEIHEKRQAQLNYS